MNHTNSNSEADGDRSVASENISHSTIITGDIKDSLVRIYNSYILLPLWLRIVVISTLVFVSTTFVLLAVFLCDNYQCFPSNLNLPHENDFQILEPSDLRVSALILDENETLWIGAQQGNQNALYWLDTSQKREAEIQHALDVENQIVALMADARGNIWLLLNEAGIRVYQPLTGESSTLLNKATTNGWLANSTLYAIATRPLADGSVEIWLGRKGIHTLRYKSDYPEISSIEFTPWEDDKVYQATLGFEEVRALHYDADNEILWAVNRMPSQMLSFFLKTENPYLYDLNSQSIWSLDQYSEETLWIGGDGALYNFNITEQTVSEPLKIDTRVKTLVTDREHSWVWIGEACAADSTSCKPLGVYPLEKKDGKVSYLSNGLKRKEVNDIVIDREGTVWLGTEKGLFLYLTSQ